MREDADVLAREIAAEIERTPGIILLLWPTVEEQAGQAVISFYWADVPASGAAWATVRVADHVDKAPDNAARTIVASLVDE